MKSLTINRKKYGVSIQETYFSFADNDQTACDLRVNFCVPTEGKNTNIALTSVIDLTQDPEKILAKFRLSHRRGIEAALNSKEVLYRFINEPCAEDIQTFCKAYDIFASEKGLPPCNQSKLSFFSEQGGLILTHARDIHSDYLICLHAFISDGVRVRLLHSISNFRIYPDDPKQRRMISTIHRTLHWFEINQFKKMNYKVYDLGGLAHEENSDLESINHFKRGFGGEDLKEYVNFTPKNVKGWLAMRYLMSKL